MGGGGRVLVVVLLEVVEVVVGDRVVEVVVGDRVVEVVTGGRVVDVVVGGRVAVVVVTGLVVVVLEVVLLVVVLVVVVVRRHRRRLATSAPRSPFALACPWQTARPSPLQRPSVLFRHARKRPPAATHAAISLWHACRHCRATDAASVELATCNVASTVSSSVDPRALSRRRISHLLEPPPAALRDGRSVAGDDVQASILPHALWAPRGARENVDVGPPFGRTGSCHSRSSSPAASTRRRSRWDGSQPLRGGLPCGREGSPASAWALARQNLEHSAN